MGIAGFDLILGGEQKHTYDSRLKRYCTEEFDKQAQFRTLIAGKVPEEWSYLIREGLSSVWRVDHKWLV